MHNVVFLHLESLNFMNYHMNKEMFPNLTRWENKSITFSRYFSTATSTLMVIADLVYGGMLQYEVCNSLGDIPEEYCYDKSIFDQLKNKGYLTKILYYPDTGDCDSAVRRHIVGFQNVMQPLNKFEEYMQEIQVTINSEQPFALMLCNTVSNIALNHNIPYQQFESGIDRWKNGFKYLDNCVGMIMDLLIEKGVLENTIIIFYGDHGDDYYAHGNHGGLTHAIEPYASLVHAPFWIYDERFKENKTCVDLISTLDIRNIIEILLNIQEEKFTWSDIYISQRKFAFARNAYAAQPVREGMFNKGYCITDGRFLLLVSNNGLELYDIEMDMQCQNNLLNFFQYYQEILYVNQDLDNSMKHHYKALINVDTKRQIRQIFYYFRKKLYREVWKLYTYAKQEEKITELKFEKIHYI